VTFKDQFCSGGGAECAAIAVGADWLEVSESCYHCTTRYVFQNLRTGELAPPPTLDSHTVLDLSSPTLWSEVCSPLSVPRNGSLTFYGRFAVASEPPASRFGYRDYLERCGSHLHERLGNGGTTGNSREIIWKAPTGNTIAGIFIPSLRRFTATLPRTIPVIQTDFVLSSRTLFASEFPAVVLSAPAPSPPRRK
jgi:hypothetical protein